MSRNAWTPAEDALLVTLPVAEVSRRTGRGLDAVVARRVKLKRKGVPLADLRTTAEKLKLGRSAWTPKADELVRQHRPYVVVRMTGIPMPTVLRRRKTLGLPPIGYPPRKPKPPRKRPPIKRWSKAELRIVLSMPPADAVKLLPRRSLSAVDAMRNRQKRQGVKFEAAKRGTRKGTQYRKRETG